MCVVLKRMLFFYNFSTIVNANDFVLQFTKIHKFDLTTYELSMSFNDFYLHVFINRNLHVTSNRKFTLSKFQHNFDCVFDNVQIE